MNKLKRFVLMALLFAPSVAGATDYYFCDCQNGADSNCAVGSDAANGTSPATAKQTFAAANTVFNTAAAGDTLNFCRGGFFSDNATRNWVNANSNAAARVTVQDYTPSPAPSVDARPIITHTGDGHPFDFSQNGSQQSGYTFRNIDPRCTGCTGDGGSVGFLFFRNVDDVLLDNVRIDGFRIGVQIADDFSSYGVVRNSQIVNSLSQGFLGGFTDSVIENNTFSGNGSASSRSHSIYWSRGDNGIIRNNTIYHSSRGTGTACSGTILVAHTHTDPMDNLLIEGNHIYENIGETITQC